MDTQRVADHQRQNSDEIAMQNKVDVDVLEEAPENEAHNESAMQKKTQADVLVLGEVPDTGDLKNDIALANALQPYFDDLPNNVERLESESMLDCIGAFRITSNLMPVHKIGIILMIIGFLSVLPAICLILYPLYSHSLVKISHTVDQIILSMLILGVVLFLFGIIYFILFWKKRNECSVLEVYESGKIIYKRLASQDLNSTCRKYIEFTPNDLLLLNMSKNYFLHIETREFQSSFVGLPQIINAKDQSAAWLTQLLVAWGKHYHVQNCISEVLDSTLVDKVYHPNHN